MRGTITMSTTRKKSYSQENTTNTTQKVSDMLKEYFESNNMVFYQRTIDDNVEIFLLPYTINKQTIRFDIKVVIFNDNNLGQISLSCELNEKGNYDKMLLNMNSELTHGRLSVETDSNQVTYTATFELTSESDVKTLYSKNLEICLSVLAKLYQKGIIKTNEPAE